MADTGFITVAKGAAGYVEMAIDLALSLRQWHRQPIAIVVDAAAEAHLARYPAGLFDAVLRLPQRYAPGWACKFSLGELSPFARSIFIDADTLVLRDLADVLAQAATADFLMMGKFRTAETTEIHHGFPIRGLIRDFGLDRYFDNHSGAFAFERAHGRGFLAECLDVYTRELWVPARRLRGMVGDELAFGVVAGRRGMASLREPYPVYWSNELRELTSDHRWKPLCHFHAPPNPAAMVWLMAEVSQRRRQAGLPDVSVPHWTRKAAIGQRRALVERWADKAHELWCRLRG